MDPDLRRKALAALRDGRVMIRHASSPPVLGAASRSITATVQSSQPRATRWYVVDRWAHSDRWECTCKPVAEIDAPDCAHIAAVKLVTGWAE